jgi:hypothetical protein
LNKRIKSVEVNKPTSLPAFVTTGRQSTRRDNISSAASEECFWGSRQGIDNHNFSHLLGAPIADSAKLAVKITIRKNT